MVPENPLVPPDRLANDRETLWSGKIRLSAARERECEISFDVYDRAGAVSQTPATGSTFFPRRNAAGR